MTDLMVQIGGSALNLHCGKATALNMEPRDTTLRMRMGTALDAWIKWTAKPKNMELYAAWMHAKEGLARAPKAMAEVEGWCATAKEKLPWDKLAIATFDEALDLDEWGMSCEPGTGLFGRLNPAIGNRGTHPDFWWREPDHIRLLDAKAYKYSVGDPAELPQLLTAACVLYDRERLPVLPGIYYSTGVLDWAKRGPFVPDWRRVVNAALLPPVAVLGDHCEKCWRQRDCSEYLASRLPSFPLAEAGR